MMKPMMLLPPAADRCQICAHQHKVTDPHDASSLYYAVKFKMDFGREPTWEDAMAHCEEEVKVHWREQLKKMFGIDTNSTYTRGPAPAVVS